MRIALASTPVKNRNIAFNLQAMLNAIHDCSGKADLILFGESVLQGFDCLCWNYEMDKRMAVALTDTPIQQVRKAAKKNNIAVSFGFIEREDVSLFSSQIFIGADGEIANVFHRISVGWKEYWKTDDHYCEGHRFEKFYYAGKSLTIGLCGDLWTDGRPEEINALGADIVLWPVWCDYDPQEWNEKTKYEYAEQAALCGRDVVLVNAFCADDHAEGCAAGGCVHFRAGGIVTERLAGSAGILITDIS